MPFFRSSIHTGVSLRGAAGADGRDGADGTNVTITIVADAAAFEAATPGATELVVLHNA